MLCGETFLVNVIDYLFGSVLGLISKSKCYIRIRYPRTKWNAIRIMIIWLSSVYTESDVNVFVEASETTRANTMFSYAQGVFESWIWQQQTSRSTHSKRHSIAWIHGHQYRIHDENNILKLDNFHLISLCMCIRLKVTKWSAGINDTQWTLPLSIHIEIQTDWLKCFTDQVVFDRDSSKICKRCIHYIHDNLVSWLRGQQLINTFDKSSPYSFFFSFFRMS